MVTASIPCSINLTERQYFPKNDSSGTHSNCLHLLCEIWCGLILNKNKQHQNPYCFCRTSRVKDIFLTFCPSNNYHQDWEEEGKITRNYFLSLHLENTQPSPKAKVRLVTLLVDEEQVIVTSGTSTYETKQESTL